MKSQCQYQYGNLFYDSDFLSSRTESVGKKSDNKVGCPSIPHFKGELIAKRYLQYETRIFQKPIIKSQCQLSIW